LWVVVSCVSVCVCVCASVYVSPAGKTCLHYAMGSGQLQVVAYVASKCEVRHVAMAKDEVGRTPIFYGGS
jgi:hypothetical protein